MDSLSAIIRKAEPSDINQMTGLLKELFSLEEDFTFNKAAQREGLSMKGLTIMKNDASW